MKKRQFATPAGSSVGDNLNSLNTGPRGPLLVQDWPLSLR